MTHGLENAMIDAEFRVDPRRRKDHPIDGAERRNNDEHVHQALTKHIREMLSKEKLSRTVKEHMQRQQRNRALQEHLRALEDELRAIRNTHGERVLRLQDRIEELRKKL